VSERCYKCGKRKCETCGGTGTVEVGPAGYTGLESCPDCDGKRWVEAEKCPAYSPPEGDKACYNCFGGTCSRKLPGVLVGADPSILCPACEAATGSEGAVGSEKETPKTP